MNKTDQNKHFEGPIELKTIHQDKLVKDLSSLIPGNIYIIKKRILGSSVQGNNANGNDYICRFKLPEGGASNINEWFLEWQVLFENVGIQNEKWVNWFEFDGYVSAPIAKKMTIHKTEVCIQNNLFYHNSEQRYKIYSTTMKHTNSSYTNIWNQYKDLFVGNRELSSDSSKYMK